MNNASSQSRIIFLGILFVLGLTGLGVKLWYVQIARGEEYTAMIRNRSQVTVRLPAVRGEILDRHGFKLVENRASFEVDFDLPELVRAYREEAGRVPMTRYRGIVRGMQRDIPVEDVEEIVEQAVIPRLQELDLARDYNSRRMQVHYQRQAQIPYNYLQNVDFETMVRLQENNIGLPGVRVEVRPVRYYPYRALAAHLLGYTGMPNEPDLEEARRFNYYQPDVEGRAQIELHLNDFLKGTAGVSIRERDVKGNITGEVERIEPKQGANVYLTIDARLQYLVEKALRAVGRAAAVVIDPNNGNILAMASVPSYDPNVFIPSINLADWSSLTADQTDPLVNRAISGYAPGSSYKIPVALAGLRAGVVNRNYSCSGGVQFGKFYMRCSHGPHGSVDLERSIMVSCNSYYYQMGNAAGEDQLVAIGNMLGLGQRSGIPLSGEASGILPGKEWLAANHPTHRWSSGYTANTSIGQGFVLATPLQMAMVAAAVANGGTAYYPRLIDKVVEQDGTVVDNPPAKVRANLITDGGLSEEDIEKVRSGMRRVVHQAGGTARRAAVKGIEIAGKTGTAQFNRGNIKDNRAWFIAFAPYENPQFAVCVMVEGAGSGGMVAAPIVGKILEDAMKLDDEEFLADFVIEPLDPAPGNFEQVALVDFNREIPAAYTATPVAAETSQAGSTGTGDQAARAAQAPSIRPDADERGRVEQPRSRNPISRFFDSFRRSDAREEQSEPAAPPPRGRRR